MHQAAPNAQLAPKAKAGQASSKEEHRSHALEALRMRAVERLEPRFMGANFGAPADNPLKLDPDKLIALMDAVNKVFPETGKCSLQPLRDYAAITGGEHAKLADETLSFLEQELGAMNEEFVRGWRLTPVSGRDPQNLGRSKGSIAERNGSQQAASKSTNEVVSDKISLKPGSTYQEHGVKIEVGHPQVVGDKVHLNIKLTLDKAALEKHQQGKLPLKLEIDGIQGAAGLATKATKAKPVVTTLPRNNPPETVIANNGSSAAQPRLESVVDKPEAPAASTDAGSPERPAPSVPVRVVADADGGTSAEKGEEVESVAQGSHKSVIIAPFRAGLNRVETAISATHYRIASFLGLAPAPERDMAPAPERQSSTPVLLTEKPQGRHGRYRAAAAIAAVGLGAAALLTSSSRQKDVSDSSDISTLVAREPVPEKVVLQEPAPEKEKEPETLALGTEQGELDSGASDISGSGISGSDTSDSNIIVMTPVVGEVDSGASDIAGSDIADSNIIVMTPVVDDDPIAQPAVPPPLDRGSVFNHENLGAKEQQPLAGLSVPVGPTRASFTPWNLGDLDSMPVAALERSRTVRINVPEHPVFNIYGLGTHSGSEHNQAILTQHNGRNEQRLAEEKVVLPPVSATLNDTPEQAIPVSQDAVMTPVALGNLDEKPLNKRGEGPSMRLAGKKEDPVFKPSALGSSEVDFTEALIRNGSQRRADSR